MATSGKDISLIEKLNNNNIDNWVFNLEMLLIKVDLFKYTEDPPSSPDENWQNNYAKTRGIINLCIEDSQIVHVKNLKTAKTIWEILKSVHQRSTLSSKLFILRKLYSQNLAMAVT